MRKSKGLRLLAAAGTALASLALVPGTAGAITVFNAKSFSAVEGIQVNQVIVSFDDPAPCAPSNYAVTITWGDGQTSAGTIRRATISQPGVCSYDATGAHTYAAAGAYAVSATICNGANCATTADPGTASISEADFRGEAQAFTATAGAVFSGQVAELKDDNQLSQTGDFTASIDWGDGTVPSPGTISGGSGNFTIDGSHNYANAGGFRVAVTVVHGGRTLVLDPATVTVNPGPATTPPTTTPTPAPTATVRILGGRVTLAGLRRNGLRLRIGVSNFSGKRLLVRLRDARTGKALWSHRITLGKSKVRNGQSTADVRVRIPRSILNRLRRGRSYGISFPRQRGLPSFGVAFRLR
jgi:hypothetical protein